MEAVRIGGLYDDKTRHQAGAVWDKNYLCPTIDTAQGGNRQPMIVEANAIRMVRTEEGKNLRKDYENGTVHHGFNEHREMELRSDGLSNTLSTVQKDNYICEKNVCAIDEQNLNFRHETFGTLTTDGSSPKHNNRVMEYTNAQYRIRKLTPKECWRLMAFTDEDFHKAEAVNSNTQLYKQAGNSIVVSVLEAIFRQMCIQNIPTWNEEKGA